MTRNPQAFTFDREKFKELLVYIAQQSEDDEAFGDTKLNKIMFFAECVAYLRLGKPITGQRFQRLPQGPASRPLLPIRREMDGVDVAFSLATHFGFKQQKTVALRDADLNKFSGEEVAIINDVIKALRDKNGKECSLLSHEMQGWVMIDHGQDVPYETAFFVERDPTPAEIDYATTLSKSLQNAS